jgi:hypothetical protein
VILFESRNGRVGYELRRSVDSHITIDRPQLARDVAALASELQQILVSHGLYEKEARAMIETWRDSWFEEGTRLFYMVPSGSVDEILPLAISPRPGAIARVFVGRLELLTPATLTEVQQALEQRDTPALLKYGRFLQPIVARLFDRDSPGEQWSRIHAALDPLYRARAEIPRCAAQPDPTQAPD